MTGVNNFEFVMSSSMKGLNTESFLFSFLNFYVIISY